MKGAVAAIVRRLTVIIITKDATVLLHNVAVAVEVLKNHHRNEDDAVEVAKIVKNGIVVVGVRARIPEVVVITVIARTPSPVGARFLVPKVEVRLTIEAVDVIAKTEEGVGTETGGDTPRKAILVWKGLMVTAIRTIEGMGRNIECDILSS